MKVLIACEESQEVCKAFRARGHEAYSCDIQEPSGGHPEWHILGDALKAVEGGQVVTMNGVTHDVGKWDLLIAHPPCTYLSVAGNRWFNIGKYGEKARRRIKRREEAAAFFISFINAKVERSVFKTTDAQGNTIEVHDIDAIAYSDNGGLTWFTSSRFRKNVTFPYEPPTRPEKIYIEYTEDVPLGWSGDKYEIITDDKERIEALRAKMQKKLDKAEESSCT